MPMRIAHANGFAYHHPSDNKSSSVVPHHYYIESPKIVRYSNCWKLEPERKLTKRQYNRKLDASVTRKFIPTQNSAATDGN